MEILERYLEEKEKRNQAPEPVVEVKETEAEQRARLERERIEEARREAERKQKEEEKAKRPSKIKEAKAKVEILKEEIKILDSISEHFKDAAEKYKKVRSDYIKATNEGLEEREESKRISVMSDMYFQEMENNRRLFPEKISGAEWRANIAKAKLKSLYAELDRYGVLGEVVREEKKKRKSFLKK